LDVAARLLMEEASEHYSLNYLFLVSFFTIFCVIGLFSSYCVFGYHLQVKSITSLDYI